MDYNPKRLQTFFLCLFFFLVYFVCALSIQAQGWELKTDNYNHSQVVATPDGGVLVSGEARRAQGFFDYIERFDASGNRLWSHFELDCALGMRPEPVISSDGSISFIELRQAFMDSSSRVILKQLDPGGGMKWEKSLSQSDSIGPARRLITTPDRGFLISFLRQDTALGRAWVVFLKTDSLGRTEWKTEHLPPYRVNGFWIENHPQGGFVYCGVKFVNPGSTGPCALRLNSSGQIQDSVCLTFLAGKTLMGMDVTSDGDVVFSGKGSAPFLARYDQSLRNLWIRSYSEFNPMIFCEVEADPYGGLCLAANSGSSRGFFVRTNRNGDVTQKRSFDGIDWLSLCNIDVNARGDVFVAGTALDMPGSSGFLAKIDTNGQTYTGRIRGRIWLDALPNCQYDSNETPLPNLMVRADPGPFYAWTDSLGYYEIEVDTGTYTVSQNLNPWRYLDPLCPILTNTHLVNVPLPHDTAWGVDFANVERLGCPLLRVDLTTPFIRRCFPGTYFLNYQNTGTRAADSVYIVVNMDSLLSVDSASHPWRLPQTGNTYVFDIGRVDVGETGLIKIYYTTGCSNTVLGQSHCSEAHIYPDSICETPDSNWDGSHVEAHAFCIEGDSVRFRIVNNSVSNMTRSTGFLVVEDNILKAQGTVQLSAGVDTVFSFAATGASWAIYVNQVPGHPGRSRPSAFLEACGPRSFAPVTFGLIPTWPHDDLDPFVSIDCQANQGAYDPNDKQAFPRGAGEDHLISEEQGIEYLIRFQNTGSDTAFKVVIRDSFSTRLDLSTIEMMGSSHPCRIRQAANSILEWVFDPIQLPDSNTDLLNSQGFIRFRIDQAAGNAPGMRIENKAGIYFDYNAPVVTDKAFNTIADDLPWIVVDPGPAQGDLSSLKVYPNPFKDRATFDWGGKRMFAVRLEVFSIEGTRVFEKLSGPTSKFDLQAPQLPEGMYLFRLWGDGQLIGTGKFILHH